MAFKTEPVTREPPDIGPLGECTVADDDVDSIEGHSGLFVHYLGEGGVGASADVLRGAAY